MNKAKTKALRIPYLITFISGALLLLMMLFPYASAKEGYKEILLKDADGFYAEEIEMTNKEAANISLGEYIVMYAEAAKQGIQKETSIACVVIIAVFWALTVLTYIMAILKKPIGIVIFDLLAMCAFKIIHFDFEDRGIIPSSSYDWGIANYLTYIIGIVILGGAIWLFIEKRKAKKQVNIEKIEGTQE